MPIPINGQKAVYTSHIEKGSGGLTLKNGDKGVVIKHTYHGENEYAFYPKDWKGYCTTVLKNDFIYDK